MLRLQSCQVDNVLAMTLYLESHKYMSVLKHFLKSIMDVAADKSCLLRVTDHKKIKETI